MKILLAEYTECHEPALAVEGAAMLKTLKESFEAIGHQVISPEPNTDFGDEIRRLAPLCDQGLVIAPDHLLAKYTKILEDNTRNLGCNSMSVAVCANKIRAAKILSSNGIDVPKEVGSGKRVIKQISGAGTLNMELADREPEEGWFGQEYIEGENISISLIGSRVVGEACEYYSGDEPLVLSLNRQNIEIDKDGSFHYLGGETPVSHPKQAEIIRIAKKALLVLGCQGYVGIDVIVSNSRIVVVDVNPRPTDSIVGISECMEEEMADLIISSSYGKAPKEVHLSGKVNFDKDGRIHT